jgi:hypothetical protein
MHEVLLVLTDAVGLFSGLFVLHAHMLAGMYVEEATSLV